MIISKKSLGIQNVVDLELDQSSSKTYVNEDGVISHNCKFCRRFYGDVGQSPKVYKLSSLLANGSNYGLKTDQWKPVVGATHPNTRTSQIIELKPGFQVSAGGKVTYIGREKWNDYLNSVLIS